MSKEVTLNGDKYFIPSQYETSDTYDHQYQKLIGLLRDGSITINMLVDIATKLATVSGYASFSLNLLEGKIDFFHTTTDLIHRVVADYELECMIENKE